LPHIELNISVAVYEQVDSVTIRLQCLYAPDAEDIYCHDVLRMMDGTRIVTISIFERHGDGVLRSLQTASIVHPSTGFKWRNVAKGEYVAYAHIPRHDCVLICEEFPSTPVSCRACKYTVINFTVAADRASISWMRLRRMRDSSPSILFALACVVAAFALCGIIYLLIMRRRVRQSSVQVQEMELHEKPLVLLLTPDDCSQHSAVVLLLGRLLEKHLGVNVLLDYREMSNSGQCYCFPDCFEKEN
uniref:SEFIR domain-containing protein n=1 Tax=Angiostrongylus cantonensis TaxID=6313 RepID=A0A158P7H6_ANGCA